MTQSSRFPRTDAISYTRPDGSTCAFGECNHETFAGLPVCFMCALMIGKFMRELMDYDRDHPMQGPDEPPEFTDEPRDLRPQAFVYYLMLSPTTVKIGTTRNLPQRITSHGSQLQYVVALELGGRDVEKARHDQFPMERHGVIEVFTLSDALKAHIETLAPQRDELFALATKRFSDVAR